MRLCWKPFYLDVILQVELPDLGKLTKLRIWHEKRNPFAGWHLSKVRNCINLIILQLYISLFIIYSS